MDPIASHCSSTEEDTLGWDFDPQGNRGDFARLKPLSQLARLNFQRVAHWVLEDGESNPAADRDHLKRFLRAEKNAAGEYEGYFRLNMAIPPRSLSQQWIIGANPATVDILVVLPEHRSSFGIARRHARMFHNLDSSTLMVQACDNSHEVILQGVHPVTTKPRMLSQRSGVMIGTLAFIVEFTDLDKSEYLRQINEQRDRHGLDSLCFPPYLTPTPTESARVIQGFLLETPVTGGTFGAVSFGFRLQGGRPVAAKQWRLRRNSAQYREVMREIDMLHCLRHSPTVVHLAEGFDSADAFADGTSEFKEITVVLEPATTHRLAELHHETTRKSVAIFTKLLEGLALLHGQGILHCDISPNNLGVSPSVESPTAAILDLGCAIRGVECNDHKKGTLPFLAPEIADLKRGTSKASFGPSADVWALGVCVSMFMLHLKKTPWQSNPDSLVTLHGIESLVHRLQAFRTSQEDLLMAEVVQQLISMLQDQPSKRPSARQILQSLRTASADVDRGQDRETRNKRVRTAPA